MIEYLLVGYMDILMDLFINMYTHTSFLITQVHSYIDTSVGLDMDVKIYIYIYNSFNFCWTLSSDFRYIPYLYERSSTIHRCQMNTVRISLNTYTRNNSGTYLTAIMKVEIVFLAAEKVGIDDLHSTKRRHYFLK